MSKILCIVILAVLAQTNALPRHLKLGVGRIVGGTPAGGPVPWQISMEYYGEHMCGGCIIDKTTVATAMHCVDFVTPEEITVTSGTQHINPVDEAAQKHIPVVKIIKHAGYDSWYLTNDIALLKLAVPLDLSVDGRAFNVEIAHKNYTMKGDGTVTGWGALKEGDSNLPTELMAVTVPFISNKVCNDLNGDVTDGMICAGLLEGGKDACQGDSGGPLVDGNNVLVGLVSWGYGCARPNYPGVYTRLSYYVDWILSREDKIYAEVRYY